MSATEASESNLECLAETCNSETKEEEDGNSSLGEYIDSPENGVACEQENENPEENTQVQSPISQEGKPFATMEGELDFEDEVNSEEKRKDSSENTEVDAQSSDAKDKPSSQSGETEDLCDEENEKAKKDDSIEEGEDDGEISDDDDLEEGEVKDFTPAPKQQSRQAAVCRFFNRGQCTWGHSCRFLHLSVSEKGHYSMFGPPNPRYSPMYPPGNGPNMPQAIVPIITNRSGPRAPEFVPALPPLPPPPMEPTPVESAWERGLRQAKELVKKANKRKEEEPDFEEKRLNLSIDVNEKNIPDFDKENDYLDKPYKRQNDSYYKYDDPNEVFDNEERTAREHWRGGRYENFEIRWTRDDIAEHRRDRSRGRRLSGERERDKFSKHGRGKERWRDDRLFEVQGTTRNRADDWIDPWRRSKTPKTGGRHTRSRSGSYSSVSSYSYSDRSSRSSCSYSRSSSRSSCRSSRSPSVLQKRKPSPTAEVLSPKGGPNRFTSVKKKLGQRSSSSRSVSRTPPSVSRSRSYSRSLSMDSVSSASSSVSHSSSASESARNRNAHVSILRKPEDKPVIEKTDSKGGSSSLYAEMQRYTKHYEKSNPLVDTSRSVTNSDVASVPEPVTSEIPSIPNVHHLLPSMDKVKDTVKGLHKQQIKLTLLNKPPPAKLMNLPKKELENLKSEALKLDSTNHSGIKRPLSPTAVASSKSSAPAPKKSASSRRDELLKQLKAVEDAIARKRAKFC